MAMRAACLALACDQVHALSVDEKLCSCKLWHVSRRALQKQKKIVVAALHVCNQMPSSEHILQLFVMRLCNDMGFDGSLSSFVARSAMRLASQPRLASRSSSSLATAVVMHMMIQSGVQIVSMLELSKTVHVTVATMHKWYGDIFGVHVSEVRDRLRGLRA